MHRRRANRQPLPRPFRCTTPTTARNGAPQSTRARNGPGTLGTRRRRSAVGLISPGTGSTTAPARGRRRTPRRPWLQPLPPRPLPLWGYPANQLGPPQGLEHRKRRESTPPRSRWHHQSTITLLLLPLSDPLASHQRQDLTLPMSRQNLEPSLALPMLQQNPQPTLFLPMLL